MKCDLPPYNYSDAALLVFMFKEHGRDASVGDKCKCGWYHIEQEIYRQCCVCKYPSRTPEQLKRTSHGICNGCLQVTYPDAFKQMVEEKKIEDQN